MPCCCDLCLGVGYPPQPEGEQEQHDAGGDDGQNRLFKQEGKVEAIIAVGHGAEAGLDGDGAFGAHGGDRDPHLGSEKNRQGNKNGENTIESSLWHGLQHCLQLDVFFFSIFDV
jgi:hypothetical protein